MQFFEFNLAKVDALTANLIYALESQNIGLRE
jgi:hypothetical protein